VDKGIEFLPLVSPSSCPVVLLNMLRKVDRILIRVQQLPAAVKYYRDVLGLTIVREDSRLATLRLPEDSTEVVLHADPDLPAEGVYFLVDNVREMYRKRAELRLKFLAPPAQVARGYMAAVKDPFGTILQLLDRSTEASTASSSTILEDAKPSASLFAGIEPKVAPQRDLLVKLYEQVGRTADDLPYTPHFEKLYEPYIAGHAQPKPSRAEVWRHLLNLRKAGKLPKLGEARSKPPALPAEMRDQLKSLLGSDIGKRDRLPYTKRFDELVDGFNKLLPRPLSPHLVWRLVATLAK
jgi:predicted enzyme related to lactoylglutathione lyase